jgi:hypothetical protein
VDLGRHSLGVARPAEPQGVVEDLACGALGRWIMSSNQTVRGAMPVDRCIARAALPPSASMLMARAFGCGVGRNPAACMNLIWLSAWVGA